MTAETVFALSEVARRSPLQRTRSVQHWHQQQRIILLYVIVTAGIGDYLTLKYPLRDREDVQFGRLVWEIYSIESIFCSIESTKFDRFHF